MKKYSVKKCLILDWNKLPKQIQKDIADHERFHNDCYLPMLSEFKPKELNKKQVEKYWKDQKKTNNYSGDLLQFIKDYGLEFEMWIIEQEFDLSDIDEIIIDVCW